MQHHADEIAAIQACLRAHHPAEARAVAMSDARGLQASWRWAERAAAALMGVSVTALLMFNLALHWAR